MKLAGSQTLALPELRQELSVYDGPIDFQGAPTWSLHDPVRNLYFKLDWATFEILSRWSLGNSQAITEQIQSETTLHLELSSVDKVREFLVQSELVRVKTSQETGNLQKIKSSRQVHWFKSLLHVYLFFRLPLFKPDQWLNRHIGKVSWLASASFTALTLVCAVLGLWEISRNWSAYQSTMVDMLNPAGLAYHGVTLLLVKLAHELGHAFVAKHYGCRVPRMGLAFLVFFPVAYTDVNDAWRLSSRRARVQIGMAGIRVELAIAAWSSLIWAFLPEGNLKTAAYLLSSTTWVSTLLINASPFMRFDGYFILMDAINLPNLHQRSFALGRWFLGSRILGIPQAKPEQLDPFIERVLIGFAFVTWIYRLGLFSGIAWMVYQSFPKPLGHFLAAIEVYWFLIKPVLSHVKILFKQFIPDRINWSVWSNLPKRVQWALIILAAFLLLPWNAHVSVEGMLKPRVVTQFQLAEGARLSGFPAEEGRRLVKNGELLAQFSPESLGLERTEDESRIKQLDHQIQGATLMGGSTDQLAVLMAERSELQARLDSVQSRAHKFEWHADRDGYFYPLDPDLRSGDWVPKNTPLAVLYDGDGPELFAYVESSDKARLAVGNTGQFYPDTQLMSSFPVKVVAIQEDSMPMLDEALLATEQGGRIPGKLIKGSYKPENAIYKVVLKADQMPTGWRPDLKVTGRMSLEAAREPLISRYFKTAMALIQRESGF